MTKIEWTDSTWTPIRARNLETGKVGHYCTRVSEGCRLCYAERMQPRFGNPIRYRAQDREKVELFLDADVLARPLRWRKPRMVFVCSMTDLFHAEHSDEWIAAVFGVMAATPQHTYQVLTKRPKRMLDFLDWIGSRPGESPGLAIDHADEALIRGGYSIASSARSRLDCDVSAWPLPNVWLGVSCEDQATADERIPAAIIPLLDAGWRTMLSLEPLLGGIVLRDVPGFNGTNLPIRERLWVIAGGESGRGARPCDVAWIRSIVEQCRVADVACFVKQLGAVPLYDSRPGDVGTEVRAVNGHLCYALRHPKGGSPDEWPEDLRVREMANRCQR